MLTWKAFGPIFLALCCESSESIRWPTGTYGIPKPATGCPLAESFQWETGWRSQDTDGEYSNNTKSTEFHLDGEVDEKMVNRSFCIKTDKTSDINLSRPSWPKGRYCIYDYGRCPTGLTKGYVYWDDDDENNSNGKGGTLPGGVNGHIHDTQIRFCCRKDGDINDPVLLPSKTPFFLLAYGSAECQMVKWAIASLEWVFFDTEDNQNRDKAAGAYPFEAGIKHPTIYYCYYHGCNETLTGVKGTFNSPHYPRKYPDGQYCSWRITVNPAQRIQLTFTHFSLQSENNTDGLYVYDGENDTGEVFGVFYGGHPPPKEGIYSSSNHMFVIFKSDKNDSYTGFSASYWETDCLASTAATSAAPTPEVTSPSTVKPGTLLTMEKTPTSKEPTPTSTDRLPDNEATEVNKNMIYGPIVGVLFVVLSVFLICTVWRLRKRQRDNRLGEIPARNHVTKLHETKDEHTDTGCYDNPGHYMDLIEATQSPGQLEETTVTETSPDTEVHDYAPLHPGTRSWEVPREQVIIDKVIGKGAFGQVAQGKSFELRGGEETAIVAIKMLKDNAPETDRKDLLSELEVMKKLKPHPHVIKLLGCVSESEPLLVIIEYVPHGDLLGYLRKSRGLNDTYYKDPDVKPQTTLTSRQLMKFSWQVADGMRYLSSRNIIHRDLAARNVLVGEEERCKVTDFGMARDVHQENMYEMKRKGRLPVKWTAYEGLLYGLYTAKSDVWSYGVLLYEIFTVGGSPYPRMDGRKTVALLQQGYRMPKPTHVDDSLYKIMRLCWQEDPRDRPTFENLTIELKEMEKQHKRLINMQDYDTALYENVEDLTF